MLKRNFLKFNLATFVEDIITFFLLAVLILRDKSVITDLHIFMPALSLFIFLNMVYSLILCTANSAILKCFFIGTVIDVDGTAAVFIIMVWKT